MDSYRLRLPLRIRMTHEGVSSWTAEFCDPEGQVMGSAVDCSGRTHKEALQDLLSRLILVVGGVEVAMGPPQLEVLDEDA